MQSPLCYHFVIQKIKFHTLVLQMQSRKSFTEPTTFFFLFNSQNIPPPTPQSTIFSLINQKENFLILIHLLLIFILCTCNIRSVGKSDIEHLNFILESGKRQLLNLIFHCTLMTDAYIKKIKSAFT